MKDNGCKRYAVIVSLLLCLVLTWVFSGNSFGAEKGFPTKDITIIVNYGAGGGRDILTRGFAKHMSKYLGVSIVVMNVTGGGGARGLLQVYNAAPDGYTLGTGGNGDVIDQIVQPQGYDNNKFTYIGRPQSSPLFLFVQTDSPIKSIKDFKTFNKPVRHCTFSLTAPSTIAPMIIAKREGYQLAMIGGYQGVAASLLGLVRGECEFSHSPISAATPHIKSGKIRPILTIDNKRSAQFPNIPTIGEEGYRDLESLTLDYWFIGPPGIHKERTKFLEEVFIKTVKDPEFLAWAKGANVDISWLGSGETKKIMHDLFGLVDQYKGDIAKYIKK